MWIAPMKRSPLERWVALALLCLGLALLIPAFEMPIGSASNPGPALVPLLVLGALIVACVGLLISQRSEPTQAADAPDSARGLGDRRIWGTIVALGLTAVLFEGLGYRISVFLLLVCLLRLYSTLSFTRVLLGALAGVLFIWLFFERLLSVQLPAGLF
jgi:hypothetical protein